MKQPKGALRTALAAMLALGASQSQAVVTFDAMGGELEVNGNLTSTVRARVGAGETYLGQWIQRLQVEAGLKYEDVGVFDELTFFGIIRPEYDVAYDTGDLTSNNIGRGVTGHGIQSRKDFNFANDALGFSGFDFILGGGASTGQGFTSTGGIGKIVSMGYQNPSWLQENFEVDFNRAANGQRGRVTNLPGGVFATGNNSFFPLVVQKSADLNLDCKHCTDLNLDPLEVAMMNTDSNGRLYPFRELYADAVMGDFWFRFGKQQIVWGKTDFFRLQDIANPVDFGQHFFFDSFEDIRIPQWMFSGQWKMGSIGPLTDNAVQVVWNFDRFQSVGLGNPSQFWGHPFSKDISTFAIFNTYFSPEPCVNPARAAAGAQRAGVDPAGGLPLSDICGTAGPNDNRTPAGFGQPVGLNINQRPGYNLGNTEAGWRWEFRVSDWRVALSHWYGWNDTPVFRFNTVNLPTRYIPGLLPNDVLVGDLAELRGSMANLGGAFGADPATGAGNPTTVARNAIRAGQRTPYQGRVLGVNDPILVTKPQQAARLLASRAGDPRLRRAAREALRTGNYAPLWTGTNPVLQGAPTAGGGGYAPFGNCGDGFGVGGDGTPRGGTFCSPVAGGQTSIIYDQAHTLGLSFDYFEQYTGTVWRVESSWTLDELVNNTQSADWVSHSNVMRWSIGIDRPTFLKWLNKDRTFFLSMQIFDTWYLEHQGDKNTGMFVDEHNFITTFFFIGNYMRDRLKPTGFVVWEEASNSWVSGLNLEWLMDNHWSIKGGLHTIWGGTNDTTHDTGPFTNFITSDTTFRQDPFVTSVLGVGRQGIGAVRDYDEIFFELKYQF